jgi:hypothetical protein
LIALKTILKEIDPLAFDEALKMNPKQRQQYSVRMDEDERKKMDGKWEKLNTKLKSQNPDYVEPLLPFVTKNMIKDYNELYSKIYDKEKLIQC